MTLEILAAGFGGQGVLFLGHLLAQAGLEEGRHVSWIPSYGPEMRGGSAHCSVILSHIPIGSPLVDKPDLLIALNQPSLARFAPDARRGAKVIFNASLSPSGPERSDLDALGIAMSDIAAELKQTRGLNLIALGAAVGLGAAGEAAAGAAMRKLLGEEAARAGEACFSAGLQAARLFCGSAASARS